MINLSRNPAMDLIKQGIIDTYSWGELYDFDQFFFRGDSRMYNAAMSLEEGIFCKDQLDGYVRDYLSRWQYDLNNHRLDECYTMVELGCDKLLFDIVMARRAEWNYLSERYLINIPVTLAYTWLKGERGDGYESILDDFFASDIGDCTYLMDEDPLYYGIIDSFLEQERDQSESSNQNFSLDNIIPPLVPDEDCVDGSSNEICDDSIYCKDEERMRVFEYLSFIAKFHSGGDKIVCYGASVCPMILELSFKLGISLICVDDYPMKRYSPFDYYSYEEFYYRLSSKSIDFHGYYVVSHFSNHTSNSNYDYLLDVLSEITDVYYSIGRFTPAEGFLRRISESKFSRILFSPFQDYAFREEGYVDGDFTVIPAFDIRPLYERLPVLDSLSAAEDDALCSCSHCDRGAKIIGRLVRLLGVRGCFSSSYLSDESLAVGNRDYSVFVHSEEPEYVVFRASQLHADENYVWNPDAWDYFRADGKRRRALFSRVVSYGLLRATSTHSLGLVNTHVLDSMTVRVRFHGERIGLRYFQTTKKNFFPYIPPLKLVLPMVAVHGVTKSIPFLRVEGRKEVVFVNPYAPIILPCPYCKRASNVFGLSLSEVIAIIRPMSSVCDHCHLMASYSYSSN